MSDRGIEAVERPQWAIIEDYLDAVRSNQSSGYPTAFRGLNGSASDPTEALKWQLHVSDRINAAQVQLPPAEHSQVSRLLAEAQHGACALRRFINSNLGWDPLITYPSHESAQKAQEVFDILELAEMILSHLAAKTLLRTAQVNKAFTNSITSSVKLQKFLGLRADSNSVWTCHFSNGGYGRGSFDGFWCDIDYEPHNPGLHPRGGIAIRANVDLFARPSYGRKLLPSVESRVRYMVSRALYKPFPDVLLSRTQRETYSVDRLMLTFRKLICQPPIYEMRAIPACCGDPPRSFLGYEEDDTPVRPQHQIIRSANGITVDDLIRAAEQISRDHRLCPFAYKGYHNERTGEVEASIRFVGTVMLRPYDPMLPPSHPSRPGSPGSWGVGWESPGYEEPEPTEEEIEMAEYIEAKKEALADGLPIPTFAEWRGKGDSNASSDSELYEGSQTGDERYADTEPNEAHEGHELGTSDADDMAWPDYYDRINVGDETSFVESGETLFVDRDQLDDEHHPQLTYDEEEHIDRDEAAEEAADNKH